MKTTPEIRVIAPIVSTDASPDTAGVYEQSAPAGFRVRVVHLDRGPASIETEVDESLAVPDILCKTRQAAAQGCSAIVISCMLDPGLDAARETVSVPVLGPAQVAMHIAAILGSRFSIVTVTDSLVPLLCRRAERYGMKDRLASVRSIRLPVLDLKGHREEALERLVDQSRRAVQSDGASVVVLGCTGVAGMARAIQLGLKRHGCEVPVIDPGVVAIEEAASLVSAGLTHSHVAFPHSPAKATTGYDWL